jgi:hypothetical protein
MVSSERDFANLMVMITQQTVSEPMQSLSMESMPSKKLVLKYRHYS